jgi:hypothetical protein
MAMSLIKECMKEKIEILTSQVAVTHAPAFVEKTNQRVKEQFNQDIEQIVERDSVDSAVIFDVIESNHAI